MADVLPFRNSTSMAQTPMKPSPNNGGMAGAQALASPAAGVNGGAKGYPSHFDRVPSLAAQFDSRVDPDALGPMQHATFPGQHSTFATQQAAVLAPTTPAAAPPEEAMVPAPLPPSMLGRVRGYASSIPWWGWGLAAVGVWAGVRYYQGKSLIPFRAAKPKASTKKPQVVDVTDDDEE